MSEVLDKVGRYAESGQTRLYLQTLDLHDLDHLHLVAEEIKPTFALAGRGRAKSRRETRVETAGVPCRRVSDRRRPGSSLNQRAVRSPIAWGP